MRDIRRDLTERLNVAEVRRNRLMTELTALDAEVQTVKNLLEIEDQRLAPVAHGGANKPTLALEDFIKSYLVAIAPGRRITKCEVRDAATAEGFDITGRNVHAYFLKLQNEGVIEKVDDDSFKLVAKAT